MDARKLHAAAEAIAQRWPNLYLLRGGPADGPLSTAELLRLALDALEAAEEVDA